MTDHRAVSVNAKSINRFKSNAFRQFLVGHGGKARNVGLKQLGGERGGDALAGESQSNNRFMDSLRHCR